MKKKYYLTTISGYNIEPCDSCGFDIDTPKDRSVVIPWFLATVGKAKKSPLKLIDGTGWEYKELKLEYVSDLKVIEFFEKRFPIGSNVKVGNGTGVATVSDTAFHDGKNVVMRVKLNDSCYYCGFIDEFDTVD